MVDLTKPQQALASSTADVIDEMLEIDGRAQIAWRQATRALRAGDVARALELLDEVAHLCAVARQYAEHAARGIAVLAMADRFEKMADRTDPSKATGEDLQDLINLTTHPHANKGGNDNGGN